MTSASVSWMGMVTKMLNAVSFNPPWAQSGPVGPALYGTASVPSSFV